MAASSGRAAPRSSKSDLPFAVFVDALDEYVAGLDPAPARRRSRTTSARSWRRFCRRCRISRAQASRQLQDERYRAHRAVRELLERIAATKPLVLVLDDAHWADPASVELIGALLRRPPGRAVLMVVAARPRQLPERLAGALERAEAAGLLSRLELERPRSGRKPARSSARTSTEPRSPTGLYEESGGNPFYLEQLARSPGRRRRRSPTAMIALADVAVPRRSSARSAEEIALPGPRPTRILLQGAAVAGDPFEPELAAAAAAVDEQAAMAAIDELMELELVRRTGVPRRFRFRHPLVRRAVYESAPGGWVLGAHERCAGALAERGASATARAHHVEYAAR